MSKDKINQKKAPKLIEKTLLTLIGVLALLFMPLCLMASLAGLLDAFRLINSKYHLPIHYSLSLSISFGFLGILLAVAGWRLINSKQAEFESLLAPFFIWFRRIAWLLVGVFTFDAIMTIVQGHPKWGGKALIAFILIVIIKKGHKLREYFLK